MYLPLLGQRENLEADGLLLFFATIWLYSSKADRIDYYDIQQSKRLAGITLDTLRVR